MIVNQLQQKDDQLAKQKKESEEKCRNYEERLQQLTAQNEEMQARIKNLEDKRIKGELNKAAGMEIKKKSS